MMYDGINYKICIHNLIYPAGNCGCGADLSLKESSHGKLLNVCVRNYLCLATLVKFGSLLSTSFKLEFNLLFISDENGCKITPATPMAKTTICQHSSLPHFLGNSIQ